MPQTFFKLDDEDMRETFYYPSKKAGDDFY